MANLTRNVDPSIEPLTLTEVKLHARISHTADDAWLSDHITAARLYLEDIQNRTFIDTTWVWKPDGFPASSATAMRVPRPPLSSVTSIEYVDSDGATQTWTAGLYQTSTAHVPGLIKPAYGQSWPTTRVGELEPVTITYDAGYGAEASSVPRTIRALILRFVTHWYQHRATMTERQMYADPATKRLLEFDRVHELV